MRNIFLSVLCLFGLGLAFAQTTNSSGKLSKASDFSSQKNLHMSSTHMNSNDETKAERIGAIVPTNQLVLDYVPIFDGTMGLDGINDGQELVFDSGPFFNVAGPPALSVLQSNIGLNTYGAGAQKPSGNSVADDFTLTATTDLTSFDFYVYQTGSNPPSVTGVYLKIWNGVPNAGGSVVWGDMNTNLLGSVSDTNVRRVLDTTTGDTSRKIQKATANVSGLTLAAGDYWVEVSFEGSGSSGPWAVPTTITGETTTGNAMQNLNGSWDNLLDSGTGTQQGIPFQVYGTQGGPFPAPYCTVTGNVYTEPITRVVFADIDNSSSVSTSAPNHEDFTSIVGNVNTGESYLMEVEGFTDGNYTNYITAWIDWNQDGVFDEASERYNIGTIVNSTGTDGKKASETISVPAGALEGNTRMRVMKKLASYPNDACTSGSSFGQTEDYTIHVTTEPDGPEYCIPAGTNSSYYINDFSTTGGIQNISNLGTGFSPGGYGDFYDNYAVEQVAGGTVNFEVDLGTSSQTYGFRIWVDWNQDGVFDTTEEVAWNSTTYQGSHSGDFTVPTDAALGETRMRIVGHWLNSQGLIDPCSTNHTYGEFEDYKFIVSEGGDEPSVEDCSFGIPSFAEVPNAYGITATSNYRVADDFVVEADVTFSLNQITFDTNQQGVPTNATIEIRSDNSGNPGGVLHTITMAPSNSVVVGSAFGDPIHHLTFDLATAIEFTEGTYWVVPTMVTSPAETIWWAATDEASYASTPRFSSDAGASWSTDPSGLHMVMTVSGECEDAGDEPEPGEACDVDFAISLDNGTGNTQTLLFADDFVIANGTSMSVDKVTLRMINNVNQITTLSFYEDAGGQPAATPLETFTNLTPDSQTVVGNNFGFDFYDVVVSLPTAVELDEGTYWIAFKNSIGTDGGTSYWAITNSGIGAPGKYSTDDGGTWTTNTNGYHYSFKLEGECEGEATEPEPGEGPCDSKIVMDCGVQYTAQLVPNAGEWVNYTGVTYSYTGSEQVFEFTAPLTGSYLFELSQGTADADFFVMDACSNTANNLIGNYWTGNNNESITLTEGQTIFIIADLYSGASSATTVSIKVNCPEDTSALNCEDHFVESDGISNGYFFTNDLAFDIPVGDNGFNIYGVELNVFIEDSTDLDFFYTLYSDNAGLPGTAIASAFGSVISSEYAGSNYGYDVYTYVVSFDSPLSLDANTTYWMQIESDGVAWESRVGALGSNLAIDNGGGWVIDDEEFVYALVCEELGLTDLSSFDFAYYPNPVQDVLNITSQKGVKEVSIFNLTGQKVVNNAKLTQGQINVSALSPGTYIFRVVLEDGKVETFKIVKK